jgi:hypothetical protein
MHVERAAPFVPLGDAGELQVAVEDPHHLRRDFEEERLSR